MRGLGAIAFIGKGNTLLWWAKARVLLDSPPDVPKLCGPTQQSHMLARCVLDGPRRAYIKVGEMGPCKWLGSIAFSMFWANSNSSARATHSHGGPMQELCLTALPMSPNYVGPHTQQSRMLARCVLDGPRRAYIKVGEMGRCECLGAIAFSMFWANSNSSARATHSHSGPMQDFHLRALPMSTNYVGPHNSLIC